MLVYDGSCGLCHRSVRFVLRHEKAPSLRFVARQSPDGADRLARAGFPQLPDSIVLFENGRMLLEDQAAFALARHLRFPWNTLRLLRFLPRPLTRAAYRCIARLRFRLFGNANVCDLPHPGHADRFL